MKYILIPKAPKKQSDFSRMFEFLNLKELAEYLGVSPYAVKNAFNDGSEIKGFYVDCIDSRNWEKE